MLHRRLQWRRRQITWEVIPQQLTAKDHLFDSASVSVCVFTMLSVLTAAATPAKPKNGANGGQVDIALWYVEESFWHSERVPVTAPSQGT
jgi:hypothetical protein